MDRYISFGLTYLARGIRRGNTPMAALGAAALGLGLLRRYTRPTPELLFSTRLKPGESLRLRAFRPGDGATG